MRSLLNRREFLKSTALAGAALSTCELSVAAPRAQSLRRGGPPKKVIVVGAGLAGLSAAYELTQAGHDVTLLEAQMRAGGRVLTLRKPFSDGLYAEAGAMLIPDTHNFTHDYVRLFDLPLDPYAPSNLKSVFYVRGKRIREDLWDASTSLAFRLTAEEKMLGLRGIWQKYAWPSSVFEEIGNPAAPDWPLQSLKKYDQMTYADFLRSQGASPEAVALLSVGRLWGNGLDRVSALAVLRDAVHLMNQKMGPFRIRGGNDLLPKAFAERLREKIRYGSPLVKIEHDARGVRAVFLQAGTPQSIAGDHLICAIPFSCLRRVEVLPRFSAEKQKAIEQLPYFSAARVSLQTRKRFWLEEGLNGFALTDLPMAEVVAWTSNQPGRRGILQGYLGGRHARRVTSMKEDERVRYTLALMEKVYPGTRENFESGISKCWDEDEWARGASSWYKPGQMSALWPHVATSEGRVHFAGDHTSAWIRWMQGALGSGIRAAREVDEAV